MKRKIMVTVLALAVLAGTAAAGTKEFWKGGIYVTPQIVVNSWGGSIPFGVNAEYGLTENIGIGGSVMLNMWSEEYWSSTLINQADVAYHFTKLNAEKFDLYAGGGLGYSAYSWKWKDSPAAESEARAARASISRFSSAGGTILIRKWPSACAWSDP